MTARVRFLVAVLAALAILVVMVCPFTLGPPAAKQKRAAAALAIAGAVVLAALSAFSTPVQRVDPGNIKLEPGADLLALVCTRLC